MIADVEGIFRQGRRKIFRTNKILLYTCHVFVIFLFMGCLYRIIEMFIKVNTNLHAFQSNTCRRSVSEERKRRLSSLPRNRFVLHSIITEVLDRFYESRKTTWRMQQRKEKLEHVATHSLFATYFELVLCIFGNFGSSLTRTAACKHS